MRGAAMGVFAYGTSSALSPRPTRTAPATAGGGPPITPLRGDAVFGDGEHPHSWEEFIGQDQAKRYLRTAIDATKWRQQRLDHVLLEDGRGGVGKTSLAKLIAWELDVPYLERGGKLTDDDIADCLTALCDYGVLFLDEVHRLAETRSKGQVLLTYMQGGKLYVGGTEIPVSPKITIIGATTEGGKLLDPLRQRFRIKPILGPYADAELARIAAQLAGKLGLGTDMAPWPTNPVFFTQVAAAAANLPRRMASILATVRDIAICSGAANYADGGYDLGEALEFLGIRPDGMTRQAADYLLTLAFQLGGVAGRQSIADTLSEPGGLTETEELLVDRNLIIKTRKGRELTPAGAEYAQDLYAEEAA